MHLHLITWKRHWKPPYIVFVRFVLFVLITTNIVTLTLGQGSTEETSDDGLVITECSAYSIKFALNDTDNYELQKVVCKSLKNNEVIGNEDFICENLEPCSTYLATLAIKNMSMENQPVFEKIVEAITTYGDPQVAITEIEPHTEDIYIAWSAKDSTCISNFVIEVKSVDNNLNWKFDNKDNDSLITGLFPCQEHNIQLLTYDADKKLISNLTSVASTDYIEPGSVTVTVEPNQKDTTQMLVKWDEPKYRTCISFYYLQWYVCSDDQQKGVTEESERFIESSGEGSGEGAYETTEPNFETTESSYVCTGEKKYKEEITIRDSSTKQFIITETEGCELYTLEIYTNSNTTTRNEPAFFISAEQTPKGVVMETPEAEATSAKLLWSLPKTHTNCVDHYQITVNGPLQRPEASQQTYDHSTQDTSMFVENLDPCGQYKGTITVYTKRGLTDGPIDFPLNTLETKPSAVVNMEVMAEPHTLYLTWEPPNFADLCVKEYRFSGWSNNTTPDAAFDKTTDKKNTQFVGLSACQLYTIQIIPVANETDGQLLQVEAETEAKIPKEPELKVLGIYPTSIKLDVVNVEILNNCQVLFARFICEATKNIDGSPPVVQDVEEGVVSEISFQATMSPLLPYTDYKCQAALHNIVGWSPNASAIIKTEPYYPDPPESVSLKSATTASLNFMWQPPRYPNGNIKLYYSHLQRVKAAYYVPPHCPPIEMEPQKLQSVKNEQPFTLLLPYTIYSIQVAAQNEYGVGKYSTPFMEKTEPNVSDPVSNLNVVTSGPYEWETEYKASVVVSWTLPCKSNGEIECFLVNFVGIRANQKSTHFQRTVLPAFDEKGTMSYNETDLKPDYSYRISVAVKTKDVEDISVEVPVGFDAPAGIPMKLSENELRAARVDAYTADNPTNSAVVRFPVSILESDAGSIVFVAFLLSQKYCNPEPELRYGVFQDWINTPSWNEAYKDGNSECIIQYQTTPKKWQPASSKQLEGSDIVYVIGSGECDEKYCNGPLRPDTEYDLVIRLFTKSGYRDAAALEFRTDALIQLALILISMSCCLLLALIAGLVYLYVTKRKMWLRESCHGIEDSFGDITAKDFATYYRQTAKPEKLSREFKELTLVAMDLSYAASEIGCNKNRYADIFPYDKNRVILDIDAEGSDYINASFIDGYRRKKEYIATQGPKPESAMDFWRMVIQHNVRVIVMVTQFREGNNVKCHEYYPFKSNSINVTVKKKDMFEIYDRTEMSVTHDKYGIKQKVVHFFFKKWPDHGCPSDPTHLITFIRKVKAEKVPSYSPVVVHCSAGVGRTGTFIGLDIIMQQLKSEARINIYETVKKLRFQRMKMVQTLAQYTFLYTCTYELVKHKAVPLAEIKETSKSSKKVSFEDDPELNIIGTMSTKLNGRRSGSDLSTVHENEELEENNTSKAKNNFGNTLSIPIRFSNSRSGLDTSMEDGFKEDCSESAM